MLTITADLFPSSLRADSCLVFGCVLLLCAEGSLVSLADLLGNKRKSVEYTEKMFMAIRMLQTCIILSLSLHYHFF